MIFFNKKNIKQKFVQWQIQPNLTLIFKYNLEINLIFDIQWIFQWLILVIAIKMQIKFVYVKVDLFDHGHVLMCS